jgi:hypothetical protein
VKKRAPTTTTTTTTNDNIFLVNALGYAKKFCDVDGWEKKLEFSKSNQQAMFA